MTTKYSLTACILLLAACGDNPDPLALAAAPERGTLQASAVAAGQRDDVYALIGAQAAAWAAHDGIAYGETYTEDAEIVNPVGGLISGRAVIAGQHVFLFNPATGPFRASTSTWSVREIVFLTGTTALVKLVVTLTGYSSLLPGLPEMQPGVVQNQVTWIAEKVGSEWLIRFQQMTPLQPGT